MRPLQSSICCHISQTHRFGQVLCQLFAAWTLGAALLPGCSQASPTQPALPLRPSSPGSTPHTIPYYAPHHPQHSALLQPPAPRGAVQAIPLTRMLQQDSLRKGLKRTAPAEGPPPRAGAPPPTQEPGAVPEQPGLRGVCSSPAAAGGQPAGCSGRPGCRGCGTPGLDGAQGLGLGFGAGGLELRVSGWEPFPMGFGA